MALARELLKKLKGKRIPARIPTKPIRINKTDNSNTCDCDCGDKPDDW